MKRIIVAAMLVGCLSLVAAGCGGGSSDSTSATTGSESATTKGGSETASSGKLCPNGSISLGIAKAKTGSFAIFDKVSAQGELIAVNQINADGGIDGCKIDVTWEDTKSDPATGGQVAQQLISDGVELLSTPGDFDLGTPASLAAQEHEVFGFSAESGSPEWPKVAGPYFIIGGLTSEQVGSGISKFCLEKGWKSAYVVTNSAFDFFHGMEESFEETYPSEGGNIVGKASVSDEASDYSAIISKISSISPAPEVIVLNDYFPHVATFIKELRAAGLSTAVVGNQTFASPELAAGIGKENLENVYYAEASFYEGKSAAPEVVQFTEEYAKEFGTAPENSNAIAGWEGVKLVADALENAGTTEASAVMQAIEEQKDIEVGGGLVYGWNEGVPSRRITITGFNKGGEPVEIQTIKP